MSSKMKSQKEVNKAIESILGYGPRYDVRHEMRIIQSNLTRSEAESYYSRYTDDNDSDTTYQYAITTAQPDNYCEDLNLALEAAKKIAEKNNHTFVLSFEDSEWKGAYGDWGNCFEYKGGNPAYVTCMAILRFMGKVS
jgi:hypothetical protein